MQEQKTHDRFRCRRHVGERLHIPDGSYIWHPDESLYFEPVLNAFCCFRKSFSLKHGPSSGRIDIFADTRYLLYVNGHYVGRGPCRSDITWYYYDSWSVADLLVEGQNCIAVLVLYYGYGTGQSASLIHGLHAGCHMEEDGTRTFTTDTSWRCRFADWYDRNAPRVNGRQGPIEIFDNRKALEDWYKPGFDDSAWPQAVSMPGAPFWNIVPRDICLLEESETSASRIIYTGTLIQGSHRLPVHQQVMEESGGTLLDRQDRPLAGYQVLPAEQGGAGVVVIDFVKVVCGYLQLDVAGPADTIIDAVYAEHIFEGRFLLTPMNRPVDRFILKEGDNRFEVAFGWKAFRYLKLIIRNNGAPVVLTHVGLRQRRYPVREMGAFTAPDDQLMRIRDISVHTLRLCMQDGFLDSSSREQQQWMGDGRWQAIINYYVTGDKTLHRKLLEQIGQSQNWLGLVKPRHPDEHRNGATIPPFNLAWISSFWDYYLYTADDSLFERWWPHLIQVLRWFACYENEAVLLENVPYWNFVDWGGLSFKPGHTSGIVTAVNIMYVEALQMAALIAEHIGDTEAQAFYSQRGRHVAEAARARLWDTRLKAYRDDMKPGRDKSTVSEITNALALLHLHNPEDKRSREIYQSVFSEGGHDILSGSPFMFIVVCRALKGLGRPETALALMRERYGAMLEAGATSTWEGWRTCIPANPETVKQIGSASHGWGANPVVFMAEGLAGIRPLAPGFSRFSIDPELCGLENLQITIPTPHGPISMEAERQHQGTAVKIEVPAGTVGITRTGREWPAGSHEIRGI